MVKIVGAVWIYMVAASMVEAWKDRSRDHEDRNFMPVVQAASVDVTVSGKTHTTFYVDITASTGSAFDVTKFIDDVKRVKDSVVTRNGGSDYLVFRVDGDACVRKLFMKNMCHFGIKDNDPSNMRVFTSVEDDFEVDYSCFGAVSRTSDYPTILSVGLPGQNQFGLPGYRDYPSNAINSDFVDNKLWAMTGVKMDAIGNVKKIDLDGGRITHLDGSKLPNSELTKLSATFNAITTVSNLNQLSTLTRLDLSYNELAQLDCSELPISLKGLDAGDIPTVSNVKHLSSLRELDVRRSKLTHLDGSELPSSLRTLGAADNPSLTTLSNMDKLKFLKWVDIRNCSISVQGSLLLDQFSGMFAEPSAEIFNLCGNPGAPEFCAYWGGTVVKPAPHRSFENVDFSQWLACASSDDADRTVDVCISQGPVVITEGMKEIASLLQDKHYCKVQLCGLKGSDGLKFLISAFEYEWLGGFNSHLPDTWWSTDWNQATTINWWNQSQHLNEMPTEDIDKLISANSKYVVELKNVFSKEYVGLFPKYTSITAVLPVTDPNVRAISASVIICDNDTAPFVANWRLYFDSVGDILQDFRTFAKQSENIADFVKRSRDLFLDERGRYQPQYDDVVNKFFNLIEGADLWWRIF